MEKEKRKQVVVGAQSKNIKRELRAAATGFVEAGSSYLAAQSSRLISSVSQTRFAAHSKLLKLMLWTQKVQLWVSRE